MTKVLYFSLHLKVFPGVGEGWCYGGHGLRDPQEFSSEVVSAVCVLTGQGDCCVFKRNLLGRHAPNL